MIFLAPIAGFIAGAIGIATVVVLYMLKLRRRPVMVSSTLLWSRAIKDMEGNVPWQRLSPTALLWLHLLIVVLMAMAIGRPVLDDAIGDGQRVYLVIDTSASMNAMVVNSNDARSGLERAKSQAIDRVNGLFDSGRSPMVSVIAGGNESKIVLADSSQRGQLIGAIRSIQASDQPGDIYEAIEFVETMHDASQQLEDTEIDEAEDVSSALVFVFSDGGSTTSDRIAMRQGGGVFVSPYTQSEQGKLGNLGVVAIGGTRDRSDPVISRVFVRVERNEQGPRGGVLRVFAGDVEIDQRAIGFEGDSRSVSETFELRLMQGAIVRVELDVDDALDTDNRAWVKMPAPSLVRVAVVAPDGVADPLLVDMLEVIARSQVNVLARGEEIPDADLVVYDRVTPQTLAGGATLGFGSVYPDQAGVDVLNGLGIRRRMISWDRADPMARESGLGSVSYQRSVVFPVNDSTRVIAADTDGSVIVERIIGQHRHVRVAFALHDSNWVVQVGLPIFLVNVVEQLLPGTSGVGEVFSTDQVIGEGADAIGPISQIGVVEFAGNQVGVSLLDSGESSLFVHTDVVIGSGDTQMSDVGDGSQHELWRWFTLLAIGLIALEWFVYAGRVKIV